MDRYTWIALETDMLAITAIERPENLHVSAKAPKYVCHR